MGGVASLLGAGYLDNIKRLLIKSFLVACMVPNRASANRTRNPA